VLGIVVLGAIRNAAYRSRVGELSVPDGARAAVTDSPQGGITIAERLGDPGLTHGVQAAFVHGMDATLWVSAAVAVLGALAMWWRLPGDVPVTASRTPAADAADAADAAESEHAVAATDSPARV
jgi:hypothetical protein